MVRAPRLTKKSKHRTQDVESPSGRSSIRVLRDEDEIREAYQRAIHAERRNAGLVNDRVAHYENLHSTVGHGVTLGQAVD
jgi:ribosome-binding protein aMBF1 (putative translation factor)